LIEIVPERTASISGLLDAFDLADGVARHAGRARDFLARVPWRRFGSLVALGRRVGHLLRDPARDDLLLAQRQQPALEVRHAAARQVVIDHPQLHVLDRLEVVVLDGTEFDAVALADVVAVMAVDQDVAPQDERVAAPFGQQAAFQRLVLDRRQRVGDGPQFLVNRDIQFWSLYFCCACLRRIGLHPTPSRAPAKAAN
jgi:hypothetical protein